MKDIKNKRFRQLKRSHAWIYILLFFILSVITLVVSLEFLLAFINYITDEKLSEEYRNASALAEIYDRLSADDAESIEKYIAGSGKSVKVFDDGGNEIYGSGELGISGTEESQTVRIKNSKVEVITEPGTNMILTDRSGRCFLNFLYIITHTHDYITQEVRESIRFDDGEGADDIFDEDYYLSDEHIEPDLAYIPVWVVCPVKGGRMVVSETIAMDIKDVELFMSFILVVMLMMVTVFIILLVNIISGAVRRNRTLNVFFTDIVTNGHNLMWFLIKGQRYITRISSRSVRFAVINISFVNYRNFCICHSVEEGEEMLCRIYNEIKRNVTQKEMLAHCASSDYAVLMQFTDANALEARVRTLLSALTCIDREHRLAFHAGIYVIEPDGTVLPDGTTLHRRDIDLETVYNNACTARETLEESESTGVAFFDTRLIDERKWVDAVQERQAAAIANEEFMVYYQPKYDPSTDRLKGAEALIRWQSPEFGFVPPGRIIPIFEKNGFITEIDHYMISHVARDQKSWLDRGMNCVPVSVNVSRAHFIESDLAEQIRDMVDREGCPHSLIEIELTESAFFDDKKAMINTISRLKSYGFAVSMDDFGSGYSSLNSLKDMPLDVLKLDAEFFRGESEDGRGEIVVAEAIRLAKNLNMRTVAEGVEVRDQVDFLASQGCDMIQGYFYAKPMPRSDFEQRMIAGIKPKDEV